ncbi:hypothetical protein L1049_027221 [Liquidambar formosana]|uniref:Uncharacterized protein n=1 Tax=Liquidambar formosana TaxID=63359 RepID=A0AAP0R3Y5_LIQFO
MTPKPGDLHIQRASPNLLNSARVEFGLGAPSAHPASVNPRGGGPLLAKFLPLNLARE